MRRSNDPSNEQSSTASYNIIMSAPIDTNNNINTDSNELAKQSKGDVEDVIPGDTYSTGPSTSASPGNPVMEHTPGDTVPPAG